jgi:hypothetical protein
MRFQTAQKLGRFRASEKYRADLGIVKFIKSMGSIRDSLFRCSFLLEEKSGSTGRRNTDASSIPSRIAGIRPAGEGRTKVLPTDYGFISTAVAVVAAFV